MTRFARASTGRWALGPAARGNRLPVAIVLAVVLAVPSVGFGGTVHHPLGPPDRAAGPPPRLGAEPSVPAYSAGVPRTPAPPGAPVRPSGTIQGFEGLDAATANCTCAAPDLAVVAGPTTVLEVTRNEGLVYATDTGVETAFSTRPLWGNSSSNITLIAGAYDPTERRFLVAAANPSPPYPSILLRSAPGTDPLGSWNATAILLPASVGFDRLSIAVGDGDVGVTGTEVNASTGAILACPSWVLNESTVAAGRYYPLGAPAPLSSACPSAPSPNAWVATAASPGPVEFVEQNGSAQVRVVVVHGIPPAALTFQNFSFALVARGDPVPMPQPGTNDTLAAPSPGIASAAASGENLSAVSTVSVGGLDAVRLLVLNLSLGTLVADTLIAPGPALGYPGIVADARDDLTIAATASNATIDPSLVTFGRPSGEVGWTTPLTWVANGTTFARTPCNATGACAWGNGSALAESPSDVTTTWFAGLFAGPAAEPWSSYVGLTAYPPVEVPLVTLTTPQVDVGQEENFTVYPTGGVGGFSYNWSAVPPPGCTSQNASVMTCRATTVGTFPVQVFVRDASGRGAASPGVDLVVSAALVLPAPSHRPASVDLGQTLEWQAQPTGGRPPYHFAWSSSMGTTCAPSSGPFVNCTSAVVGSVGIGVSVSDLNLAGRTNSSAIEVLSAPTLHSLVIDPDPTAVGTPVNLSINATGGSGGYTFAWADLPDGCVSIDRTSFTCVPEETGNFSVTVSANDTNGLIALANATLSVGPAPPPPPAPPASAAAWELPALLGGIGVVVAVAIVLLARRGRTTELVPTEDPP